MEIRPTKRTWIDSTTRGGDKLPFRIPTRTEQELGELCTAAGLAGQTKVPTGRLRGPIKSKRWVARFRRTWRTRVADEKLWRAGCDERWRYSSTVFLLDLCNLSGSLGSNWKPSCISLLTDFRTLSAEILRRTSSRAAPVSAAGVAVSSA
jgi:hypothetical protein